MLESTHQGRGVLLCLDLHGHSKKKNAFVYGCDVNKQPAKLLNIVTNSYTDDEIAARRIYTRVFPNILCTVSNSISNGYFNYSDCSFGITKDKLGTGRFVGWNDTKIEGIYTIESSFCSNGNNKEKKIIKNYFKDMEKEIISDDNTVDNGKDSRCSSSQDSNKLTINNINKKNNSSRNNREVTSPMYVETPSSDQITRKIKLGDNIKIIYILLFNISI